MGGRGEVSKRLTGAAWLGLLGLAVALTLAMPGARSPQREPLVPKTARGAATAVPLESRESRKRTSVHRVALRAVERVLLDHEELHLFFAGEPTRRELVRAELRVRASGCVLEAAPGRPLVDGQPVVFRRIAACTPAGGGTLDADLTVELAGQGRLSLLAFEPPDGMAAGPIQVPRSAAGGDGFDVRGAIVDYTPPAPRIELLNAMWRLSSGTGWLWLSLSAGIGLAIAAWAIFPTRAMRGSSVEPAGARGRAATGAALLAASLGVLYAVLVPPLMGPDEPYHMLGFAELASDPRLAGDTVTWMGETHLWRIRQQPTERFRSIDVGRPYVEEDAELRATEVAMRSAVLARLWNAAAPFLVGRSAPSFLLTVRLLNVLVFAAAVAVATAFAVAAVDEPFPQWLSIPCLLVPSLPFFAMHVSETALLCSIYVVLATAVAVLFLDGPRAHWAGGPLGIATGLMLAGGRSPWPLAALVVAVLLGRVLLGSNAAGDRRAAILFWGGFVAGVSVLFVMQDEAYVGMIRVWAEHFTTEVPPWLREGGEWLLARPAAWCGLAVAAGMVEVALSKPRAWLAARLSSNAPSLVRAVALGLGGFVLLSLAASLVVRLPQLELEPKHALTAVERVVDVVATMATMFRLTQPNFLLSTSFWVGFGWLDTSPGPLFQAVLVVLLAAALLLLLRQLALRAQARRLLWLLMLTAGGVATLVLYTLTTQVSKPLHGRYLIGWYLCLVAVVGSSLTFDYRSGPATDAGPPSGGMRAGLLLAAGGLIHVYCLCFILARYF